MNNPIQHHHHHHHSLSRIRLLDLFHFRIYFLKLKNLFRHLIGHLGRGIGPTQGLYLYTGQHNTEKRGHTSMPGVGFEPTISVLERPKTVRALDRAATETGKNLIKKWNNEYQIGLRVWTELRAVVLWMFRQTLQLPLSEWISVAAGPLIYLG